MVNKSKSRSNQDLCIIVRFDCCKVRYPQYCSRTQLVVCVFEENLKDTLFIKDIRNNYDLS